MSTLSAYLILFLVLMFIIITASLSWLMALGFIPVVAYFTNYALACSIVIGFGLILLGIAQIYGR